MSGLRFDVAEDLCARTDHPDIAGDAVAGDAPQVGAALAGEGERAPRDAIKAKHRAAIPNRPRITDRATPHPIQVRRNPPKRSSPGTSVPLEDGVKEFVMLDCTSLNSPPGC